MVETYEKQLAERREELERTTPLEPKFSPKYLNLVKIMDTLADRQEYEEAHRLQVKIAALEEEEKKSWAFTRARKID
jgi:hypothetical protein